MPCPGAGDRFGPRRADGHCSGGGPAAARHPHPDPYRPAAQHTGRRLRQGARSRPAGGARVGSGDRRGSRRRLGRRGPPGPLAQRRRGRPVGQGHRGRPLPGAPGCGQSGAATPPRGPGMGTWPAAAVGRAPQGPGGGPLARTRRPGAGGHARQPGPGRRPGGGDRHRLGLGARAGAGPLADRGRPAAVVRLDRPGHRPAGGAVLRRPDPERPHRPILQPDRRAAAESGVDPLRGLRLGLRAGRPRPLPAPPGAGPDARA